MKLEIDESIKYSETEILIKCQKIDKTIKQLITYINMNEVSITGRWDDKTYKIMLADVFYFESVDGRTFIYTTKNVFECTEKLYELDEKLKQIHFVRISKSTILNIHKLINVRPLLYGRIEAQLENETKIVVSRHYVKELKEKLDF